LQKVTDRGLIRVIDLLFVTKDETGKVSAIYLENMTEDVVLAFESVAKELSALLSESDAGQIGEMLDILKRRTYFLCTPLCSCIFN